jgi:23S rRNA pseudouridine1911/1915/1917 synthase
MSDKLSSTSRANLLAKPVEHCSIMAVLSFRRMDPLLNICHEDIDLLVVSKPAGLVCHPTKGDELSSLVSRVRLYLGGAVPYMVHRLDRETSGVMVFAKTREGARELARVWESRAVEKIYWALVWGHPELDQGAISAPLGKDVTSCIAIKDCVKPDGVPARTTFRVLRRGCLQNKEASWIEARPVTGRKHQIRIHLQYAGHPIIGDKLYGGNEMHYLAFIQGRLSEGQNRDLVLPWQALHARSVAFDWRNNLREFSASPEFWFEETLRGLGGLLVS